MDDMEQAERLANTYADAILRLSYTYLKNTHDAQSAAVYGAEDWRRIDYGAHDVVFLFVKELTGVIRSQALRAVVNGQKSCRMLPYDL